LSQGLQKHRPKSQTNKKPPYKLDIFDFPMNNGKVASITFFNLLKTGQGI
jgi:hypothetical protein